MAQPLRIHPNRDAFARLAAEHPLVPVWTELLADVTTPVGLFPAVAGTGPGILLESVERSERWGRYSFVAGDPAATIVVDGDGLRVEDQVRDVPLPAPGGGAPLDQLRRLAGALRGPRLPDLPTLIGGLMGYLG